MFVIGAETTNGFLEAADKLVLPLIAAVATWAGLWFAHNHRRQMRVQLAETRRKAYSRLWEISGIAAPTRLDVMGTAGHLEKKERSDLWNAMTDWYYADGNGMLLGEPTKTVYLHAKHNLVCRTDQLKPHGLAEVIQTDEAVSLDDAGELSDELRGLLAIRQLSLLRTQLKSDLAIYGQTYHGRLETHELFFLHHSHVDLGSKAWARGSDSTIRLQVVGRKVADAMRWLKVQPSKRRLEAEQFKVDTREDVPWQRPDRSVQDGHELEIPAASRQALKEIQSGKRRQTSE